jgi:molybdate transport system permease protein
VLPPVVGGIALQTAFGTTTPIGTVLQHLGIVLPFSTAGAAIAEAFVGFPFLVITVEAGLRQRDDHLEEVAATLGARPWRRFWQVTMPWRIRRHDHVCRELPRYHRDAADRRVQLIRGLGSGR